MSRSSAVGSACLLVIDAACADVELALQCRGQRHVDRLPAGAEASRQLHARVGRLIEAAGIDLQALDAVGFGAGPGAFTGLRTACAMAQGLAFGLDRPVLALDTLAVVAESAWLQGAPTTLWACVDARMGEVYAAPLQRLGAARWQALAPAATWAPEALCVALHDRLCLPSDPAVAGAAAPIAAPPAPPSPPHALAGPAIPVYAKLAAIDPARLWPAARPAGDALLDVAQAAWQAQLARPADGAVPVYVRDKVALTQVELRARRALAADSRPAHA